MNRVLKAITKIKNSLIKKKEVSVFRQLSQDFAEDFKNNKENNDIFDELFNLIVQEQKNKQFLVFDVLEKIALNEMWTKEYKILLAYVYASEIAYEESPFKKSLLFDRVRDKVWDKKKV